MDTLAGTSQWLVGLAADEKRRATPKQLPEIFAGSRAGSANIISESGLYKLIMRSDKPEAKAFQDWVTRDVLPAIRKDGGYVMGEERVASGELSEDELVLKALDVMNRKVARLQDEKRALAGKVEELKPLATLGERVERRQWPACGAD